MCAIGLNFIYLQYICSDDHEESILVWAFLLLCFAIPSADTTATPYLYACPVWTSLHADSDLLGQWYKPTAAYWALSFFVYWEYSSRTHPFVSQMAAANGGSPFSTQHTTLMNSATYHHWSEWLVNTRACDVLGGVPSDLVFLTELYRYPNKDKT